MTMIAHNVTPTGTPAVPTSNIYPYLHPSHRVYISVLEANTVIPAGIRFLGLTVNIGNVEYWYKNGITNESLIVKQYGATSGNIVASTPNTGNNINMSFIGGNSCNMKSPNTNTLYTYNNLTLNGNATVLINAVNEPKLEGELTATISGTNGTTQILIGSNTYEVIFNTNLATTVNDFVTSYSASINSDLGITIVANGNSIVFKGESQYQVTETAKANNLQVAFSGSLPQKIAGSTFEPTKNMHLCLQYLGSVVQYYLLKL